LHTQTFLLAGANLQPVAVSFSAEISDLPRLVAARDLRSGISFFMHGFGANMMSVKSKTVRQWILVLLLGSIGATSMTGCIFVDHGHGGGWHHDGR
jgi:hypothetical protein